MAFKMKGFNPGSGTGMGSAFNKASNDPPPKKDDEIKYSTNLAKWEEAKNKNRTWRDSQKREELVNKDEPSGGYDEHGNALEFIEDGKHYVGSSPAFMELLSGPVGKTVKGVQTLSKGKGIIHNAKNLWNKAKNFKFGKTTKVKPTPPKVRNLGHYGVVDSQKKIDDILNITKTRGKMYDDLYTKKPWQWSSKNFIKQPTVSGRQMVDLNVKGLPPQRFYRSTGGGGKLIDGKPSTGKWVPLEGYGHLKGGHNVKNWFVKGDGWDKGYGSKLFNDMDFYINKFAK